MKDNNDLCQNLEIKTRCKYHKTRIACSVVLKDGKFATSSDSKIIICNNKTFKIDLIINENYFIFCLLQLSSGKLASSLDKGIIKIYNIKDKIYEVLQTLKYHKSKIYKIIELSNKQLVSCSNDHFIFIYSKTNNNKYIKDYPINVNHECHCITQTKENEISFYAGSCCIQFYDLLKKKIINKIDILGWVGNITMITKDLLLLFMFSIISIINVNHHKCVRRIYLSDFGYITGYCKLNKNNILIGGYDRLKQLRIEGDDLKIISETKNIEIYNLLNLGNGHILLSPFSYNNGDITIYYLKNYSEMKNSV